MQMQTVECVKYLRSVLDKTGKGAKYLKGVLDTMQRQL